MIAPGFCLLSLLLLAGWPATAGDCPAPSILLNAFDNNRKVQRDLRAEEINVEVDGSHAEKLSLSLDTRVHKND